MYETPFAPFEQEMLLFVTSVILQDQIKTPDR